MDDIKYLFEDENIIVCHKPSGMATQSAKIGTMDVVSEVKNHIARDNRNNKGRQVKSLPPYVALINRLDQPVEGIVLLAKDKKSAANLSRQLTSHSIDKLYYAVVCARPIKDKERLINYINREKNGNAYIEADDKNGAKKASLKYEIKKSINDDKYSLLKIELETGRFHQIRTQLSYMGCPIYGDSRYGFDKTKDELNINMFGEIALCSYELSFKHPISGKDMKFTITPSGEIFKLFFDKEMAADE
ncbi:MAG: RluA family pseudouridine synthase [Butyrivibrio sp.]|nr:RluA family pseudouridine synthase [Butyrivibrio sp.]